MSKALAEIAVADADPATLKIYRHIMDATGVGSPALIYRHIAVYPGFLDWVWRLAGPEIESGHVVDHALAAAARAPVVALPPIDETFFQRSGLDPDARALVRFMLATYNRMNPVNFAIMSVIRALILNDIPSGAPPLQAAPPAPPVSVIQLPPPINVADMPADLQETLRVLSAAIPSAGDQAVTPTLYRHFAIWPDFMRNLAPILKEALDDGRVDAVMQRTIDEMQSLIGDIATRAKSRDLPPAPLDNPVAMAKTLDAFLIMIPQLIAIGRALDAAIEEP